MIAKTDALIDSKVQKTVAVCYATPWMQAFICSFGDTCSFDGMHMHFNLGGHTGW